MGKGDKRSRRGKIWKGSFGNSRRKKAIKKPAFVPKPKVKKPAAQLPLELALADVPVIESTAVAEQEVKVAKPKKVSVKKPKVEGETKEAVKKEPKKKAAPEKKKEE
jgi:ribosomal small subunit protein bTHX